MTSGTTNILALGNGYGGVDGLTDTANMIQDLLKKYAAGGEATILYY